MHCIFLEGFPFHSIHTLSNLKSLSIMLPVDSRLDMIQELRRAEFHSYRTLYYLMKMMTVSWVSEYLSKKPKGVDTLYRIWWLTGCNLHQLNHYKKYFVYGKNSMFTLLCCISCTKYSKIMCLNSSTRLKSICSLKTFTSIILRVSNSLQYWNNCIWGTYLFHIL